MIQFIRYLLITLAATLLSTSAFAVATCQKTGEVCIDGPSTKMIAGTPIYRDCWDYKATYNCVDPNSVDYCNAIANTPGCNIVGSVCNGTAFNGTCLSYTNTYKCGTAITPTTGVVQLTTNYTIIYDNIDTSPCNSYSTNPSCQLSAKTCIDGPATKNINGLDVYRDCWQWKEDYNCVVSNPIDYCMPLKQAGCQKLTETCTNTAFTGACIEKSFQYTCEDKIPDPLPTNVVQLDTTYTIVNDQTNMSQCQSLDNNPNCTVASQVCIDGPGTKNINGLDVYKDCWQWKKEYTCASTTLTSTCDDLKNNPLCSETTSSCVESLPDGSCGLLEHQYKCADSAPDTSVQTDCGLQTFCINGQCFDTGYMPDGDFANAITHMELAREAVNYDLFVGEASHCHKNLLTNCCKAQGGGEGGRNDVIAQTIGTTALKVGAEEIYVWGSKFIFEGLMNSGSEMLAEYAMSMLGSGTLSMTANFSVWGAEFAVSTNGIAFVGFDPWSLVIAIAIYVIMEMIKCKTEEQTLDMKRGQGLCHQVGSWCSSKILGACVEKKEGWCCFPSKLGRIVNEQGRAQIGKSWGSPQSPDCSGFTLDELKLLRFDLMDLSEFFSSIQTPTKSSSFAVDRLQQKAQSYYGN